MQNVQKLSIALELNALKMDIGCIGERSKPMRFPSITEALAALACSDPPGKLPPIRPGVRRRAARVSLFANGDRHHVQSQEISHCATGSTRDHPGRILQTDR